MKAQIYDKVEASSQSEMVAMRELLRGLLRLGLRLTINLAISSVAIS